jgi:hypothetical protein
MGESLSALPTRLRRFGVVTRALLRDAELLASLLPQNICDSPIVPGFEYAG